MQGRWTIWRGSASGQLLVRDAGFTGDGATPVVPCDDAAIERGAAGVERELGGRKGFDALLDECDEDVKAELLREVAEAVLRAAGETP